MTFDWTPDLSVGIDIIDRQHKDLFKAVDELSAAMWEGKGSEQTGNLLTFLSDYVVEHFGAEELLMDKSKYPAADGHKKLHKQFVQEFEDFRAAYLAGKCESGFCINVLNETCDWLRNHIRRVDKELGSHIKKHEAAGP